MNNKEDYVIEINNITKKYDSKEVLDSINLKVKRGSVFGLLGPNGSGKTTLINILSGILKANSGTIKLEGISFFKECPITIKKSIGIVLELPTLFNMMTIWEHILLTGPLYGLSIKESENRGKDLLHLLGLWENRNAYIDYASYGMKKKLSIAMALIHSPSIIFMDEPFKGLDPISGKLLRELIKKISNNGVTFFLSTHIISKLEKLINEFAILKDGKIVHSQIIAKQKTELDIEEIFFKHINSPNISELRWLK